jgi:hypothetical protein
MSPGTHFSFPDAGAAPHRPAGHFSPYGNGEKGGGRNLGPHLATLVIGEIGDGSTLLPVTIRGEDAGRQVRGGANFNNWRSPSPARNEAGVTQNGA